MADCVWTVLAAYGARAHGSETETLGQSKPNPELFDRMCNVYGWTNLVCRTKEGGKAQVYEYRLECTDARKPLRECGMIANFKHTCKSYHHSEYVRGDYESAVKRGKQQQFSYVRSLSRYLKPMAQIEVDGAAGDDTIEKYDAENTQVTEDTATDEVKQTVVISDSIQAVSSTEKLYKFESILNRYVPLKQITIGANKVGLVTQYKLPFDLNEVACVSNTLPLEQMMYGDFDIEVMVKPNAQKFQAGLGFVSILLDSAGLDDIYSENWEQAVQRPHAWFDVAGTTAAKINMPFEYRRTFVRNLAHGQNCAGVEGGVYVTLQIFMASPVNVASPQATDFNILPFIKITRANFAGMAFKVPIAQGPIKMVRRFADFIKEHDSVLETISDFTGLDKPAAIENVSIVVPTPRLHFPNSKGLSDATIMRLNPAEVTSMPQRCRDSIKHHTIYDIARTWGYLGKFDWSTSDPQGKVLFSFPLESANFANLATPTDQFVETHPPPISAIARMYQLETGTREFQVRFVSTGFHSGSVTITMEYGRTTNDTDLCEPYSSYFETWDLGETKMFETGIPYIFDTPWRRTCCVPLTGHRGFSTSDTRTYRTGVVQSVNTRVVVRVANPLRCTSTVATTIAALCFIRAGEDWRVTGSIQNNGVFEWVETGLIYNFPSERYPFKVTVDEKTYIPVGGMKKVSDAGKTLSKVLSEDKKRRNEASVLAEIAGRRLLTAEQHAMVVREKERAERLYQDIQARERLCESTAMLDKQRRSVLDKSLTIEQEALQEYAKMVNKYGVRKDPVAEKDVHTSTYSNTPIYKYEYSRQNEVTGETENLYLKQKTMQQKTWVYVGSSLWSRMAALGALLPQFEWETIKSVPPPAAQGLGDMTSGPLKFNPGTLEPTQTLASSSTDSIWDALKKPVCVMYRRTVKMYNIPTTSLDGGHNPFLIPIIPPQKLYCEGQIVNGDDRRLFDPLLRSSPHVSLTSMFRWYRGSQRYTFVWYGKNPVYFQYLPKSGTRLYGEYNLCRKNIDAPYMNSCVLSSGLTTEMLVPQVNPVAHIEIPYISENPWTTLNNGRIDENWAWRDKGDDCLGHIAVIASEEAALDVWWAAGNDFRLGGWLGCLPQARYRLVDTLSDDSPRAQADFRLEEGQPEMGVPSAQMMSYVSNIASLAMSSYTTYNVNKTVSDASKMIPRLEESSKQLLDVMLQSKEITNEVHSLIVGNTNNISGLVEKIVQASEGVLGKMENAQVALTVLLDVYLVWKVPDMTVLATTLVRWFVQSGIVGFSNTTKLVGACKKYLMYLFEPRAQALFDDTVLEQFIAALTQATGLVGKIGVQGYASVITFIKDHCALRDIVSLGRTLDSFHRFITGIVNLVRMIWLYFVGRVDPDVKVYTLLTERNETFTNFIVEAQRYMQVGSREQLKVSPCERLKFYSTVQLGCLIQKVLIKHPEIKVASPLLVLINKLLKMADEVGVDLLSSPVRFEPMVILLHGETRIGKSYLVPALVSKLLEKTGWIGGSEPIYIRTPGQEFWNGYVNQPVVVFDDIDNIDETQVNIATIADIFALKSSAAFNPNMARLEEKDKRGNPLLVVLLTNKPFPKLPESADKTAYFSRRDVMYKVSCDQSVEKNETFAHLKFARYVETIPTPTTPEGVVSPINLHYEAFIHDIENRWQAYFLKEKANVRYRWHQMLKSMKSESEQLLFDYDPYSVMTRHLFRLDCETREGEQRVVDAMQLVFNNYCVAEGLEDVVDFFSKSHLDKLTPRAQGFPAPPKREDESASQYQDRLREYTHNVLFDEELFTATWYQWQAKGKTDNDFRDCTRVFLDMMAFFKTRQFMDYVARKTGYTVGTCSLCGRTEELMVRRCLEEGGPLCLRGCNKQWCFVCVNSGAIKHGMDGGILRIPENYSEVTGAMLACVHAAARAMVIPIRFAGFLLIRIFINYKEYMECVGSGAMLASFWLFITGNFMRGATYLSGGFYLLWAAGNARKQENMPGVGPMECIVAMFVQSFGCAAMPYKALKRVIMKYLGCAEERTYDRSYQQDEPRVMKLPLMIEWMEQPVAQAPWEWCKTIEIKAGPFVSSTRHNVKWTCCQHYDLFDIEWIDPLEGTSAGELSPTPTVPNDDQLFGYNSRTKVVSWAYDVRYKVDPTVLYIDGVWEVNTCKGRLKIPNRPCINTCILRNPAAVEVLLKDISEAAYFNTIYHDALNDNSVEPPLPFQFFDAEYVYTVWGEKTPMWDLYAEVKKYVFSDWWTWLKKGVSSVISKGATWLVLIGFGAALVWRVWKYFTPAEVEEEEMTMPEEQSPKEGRPKFLRKLHRKVGKAQACEDNVMAIATSVMRNQITLRLLSSEGRDIRLCGLGIAKHKVLFPRHYWPILGKAMSEGWNCYMYGMLEPTRSWPVLLSDKDFVVDSVNDFMCWECVPQYALFADIRKHFASVKFYEENGITSDGFLVIPPIRDNVLPVMQQVHIKERLDQVTIRGMADESYDILDTVTYNFSLPGACGAPLYRYSSVSPILGIHVAGRGYGTSGVGYCPLVTRELLDEFMGGEVVVSQAEHNWGPLEDAGVTFGDEIKVHEVGSVVEALMIQQPSKTKIIPTAIAEDLDIIPTRVPVPLGPDDPPYNGLKTTPFYEGIKHHGEIGDDLGSAVEEEMFSAVSGIIHRVKPMVVEPKILTVEQAIVGLPGVEFYDAIDLQTSAGWPWCKKKEDTTKAPWIKYDVDSNLRAVGAVIDKELEKSVIDGIEARKKGIVQNTVFSDCMKDEKKDRSKLGKLGKTRIFCMSPVDLTIVVRMYFLHFIAAVMKNRLRIPSAVGIAPDSYEWGYMISELKRVNSKYCWTFDYHNFGPAFSIRAARASFKVMIQWCKRHIKGMTTEDEVLMECVMYEHINSLHLARNLIYQQGGGSPSGSALTSIINTLVNMSYIMWVGKALLGDYWKRKHYKPTGGGHYDTPGEEAGFYDWFFKVVSFYCYGDDIGAASSMEILDLFNAKTIALFLKDYGITATDGTKGDNIKPYVTYDEFSFLKRGCVEHPELVGQYLAPVQWNVVQEAAYYTWKTENLPMSTRENAIASVVLAYGHGPDLFGEWREKVNTALANRNIDPINVSWYDLDKMFYPLESNGVVVMKTSKWSNFLICDEWQEYVDLDQIVKEFDKLAILDITYTATSAEITPIKVKRVGVQVEPLSKFKQKRENKDLKMK